MLDDSLDLWLRAHASDAGAVKDPALARLGAELVTQVRDWIGALSRGEHAEPPCFADAETLVLSRLTNSIIAGAVCAREIACRRDDGPELLIALYRRAPARSRALMLRYSTSDEPEWEETTVRLAVLGLADRSRQVREFAMELVTQATAERLLGPLRDAIARETSAETADDMRVRESLARQGYWLGEADEIGLRPIEFRGLFSSSDLCRVSVPAIAVQRLGEAEVVRRVRTALTEPDSEEAAWARAARQEWRRERGFTDD